MPEKIKLNKDLVIEMYQSQNYNVASLARFFKISISPGFHYTNLRPLWEIDNTNKLHTNDKFLSIRKIK